ncbi:MAG: hypothetical protein M9928_17840 [Anaerolineae bacterium]|nr:hypothetical protein [Anaerolineae bacterium]
MSKLGKRPEWVNSTGVVVGDTKATYGLFKNKESDSGEDIEAASNLNPGNE